MEILRRFLVIVFFAFWVGGFFFYAGVVIHIGRDVLGGHRPQGFVTQRVSVWMNGVSLPALAVFFWNVLASRRARARWLFALSVGSWVLMLAIQIALVIMHPRLDAMLDPSARRISGGTRFYDLHAGYMTAAAVQHFIAVLHLACALWLWRIIDLNRGAEYVNRSTPQATTGASA